MTEQVKEKPTTAAIVMTLTAFSAGVFAVWSVWDTYGVVLGAAMGLFFVHLWVMTIAIGQTVEALREVRRDVLGLLEIAGNLNTAVGAVKEMVDSVSEKVARGAKVSSLPTLPNGPRKLQ